MLDYPIEVWCIINNYLDYETINNLLIVLTYNNIDTKNILRTTIMKKLTRYKILFYIYNNLDKINNRQKYIYYNNLVYELEGSLYYKIIIRNLIEHLTTNIKNETRLVKFKHIVRYKNIEYNNAFKINPYFLRFLKCI
jgi:hypothetical protein